MDSDIVTMIQILKLDELQLKEYLDLGEYKKVCSVTKLQLHQTRNFLDMDVEVSDDEHDYEDLFYIHPEAIDKRNGTMMICAPCHASLRRKQRPAFSIANRHDYGDIMRLQSSFPNLRPLSVVEKHVIGRCRPVASFIKLQPRPNNGRESKTLTGHVISFPHNGPEMIVKSFPNIEAALNNIKVIFVDVNGKVDGSKETGKICMF